MRLLAVAILLSLFGLLTLLLAALKYKNSLLRKLNLLGAAAVVEQRIAPEGSVLISGELWRASSPKETVIEPRSKVRVVGFGRHLLLVEPAD